MTKRLGIIGGGQLGMMITEAAQNLSDAISEITVLDPTVNCPAVQAGAKQIVGDYKDEDAIVKLAEQSDIITYEIESGNTDVLSKLEAEIEPSPSTLGIIQDKLSQKTFLSENGLSVSQFYEITSLENLHEKIKELGLPVLLKARRDAYDGRGNFKITSPDEIEKAYQHFDGKSLMVEKFVNFKMEVSVIAARNTKGEIAVYPLVENIHENNILKITIAPARVSNDVIMNAGNIAKKTMEVLKGAGVFGIEMFIDQDDKILINEIAPRVHNSGHHTLQSCRTSQFEQHLRAIFGLDLGSTDLIHKTVMCNILGPDGFEGKYKPVQLEKDGAYLKMYGKSISKPQRKLGHFNVVDISNSKDTSELLEIADEIKNSILINPLD
ncbi:MAG: 5-(carboxyamino)imidazole ribonucleotide synthase [Thermoproteota archaeon]|uniref:N5-carboxyaminoimidazole ribonucleotide synthase n=1 Tax=uncultured marine thaumarchaeote KM3_53_C08 TaxID=1456181 RepID=A0A075HAY6_9ARCH|nr:phosphoribosylaminoimidazole carboxylase, ATPase subunit (purK) [uncultured marine thaumarchaeote KM3_53_C08]MEA2044468.1 5-(carboxyamino)imidazole ribonucleotide synthase [Thermoproteota archaeon]